MDTNLLLIIILFLLTLNFLFIGVFVVLLLKDLRKILQKSNLILDDVHSVTGVVSKPVGIFMGVLASLLEGAKAVNSLRTIKENSDRRKEDNE